LILYELIKYTTLFKNANISHKMNANINKKERNKNNTYNFSFYSLNIILQ